MKRSTSYSTSKPRPLQAAFSHSLPPSSNTGAQATFSSRSLSVLVDWLSFTVPDGIEPRSVLSDFDLGEWVDLEHGAMGYRSGIAAGPVRIYFDGGNVLHPMGVHVVLSGQGCRALEAGGLTDWVGFMVYILDVGWHISRLDVAMDDREGLLNLAEIERCLLEGECTSRWGRFDVIRRRQIGGRDERKAIESDSGPKTGETVYVGSRSSSCYLRFYDKAAEQGIVGVHWVRCELETKSERAEALVRLIASCGPGAVAGILRSYLTFRAPGGDSNRSRWAVVEWWLEFLSRVERLTFGIGRPEMSLLRVRRWVSRQVAPSLALLLMSSFGDLSELLEVIRIGRSRLRPAQLALVS